MTIQQFTGPIWVYEKCIFKPEWLNWEKLVFVDAGQTAQVSDNFWNLQGFENLAQAKANVTAELGDLIDVENPQLQYEIHQLGV